MTPWLGDINRDDGYFGCNQASHNQDIWPQTALTAFLGAQTEDSYGCTVSGPTVFELPGTHITGRLIIDLVATDAFPSQRYASFIRASDSSSRSLPGSREILQWPPQFVQGSHIPTIDYTCRAVDFSFGSHQKLYPLLYAAQYEKGDRLSATHKLAIAFQPMMMLFILYYLDTRTRRDEPMPAWMFLFGAVYNDTGFTHHIYHPVFRPPAQIRHVPAHDWGWGAVQADFRVCKYNVTTFPALGMSIPLAALDRVQGHCRHVLECLSKWDGYQQALDRLSGSKSRH
jgi:hypothetical protein